MPQNEYMDRWRKLHGRRLDHEERTRKKAAREGHRASEDAQKLTGLRAKLYQKKRHHDKIQMTKQIKAHEERNVKSSAPNEPSSTPLPQYLLDRSNPTNAKALSSAIKNKRAEKAAKFSVPLPKVRGIAEEEMFKVWKQSPRCLQGHEVLWRSSLALIFFGSWLGQICKFLRQKSRTAFPALSSP
jgi:ribosome biogenesis protein NSA2